MHDPVRALTSCLVLNLIVLVGCSAYQSEGRKFLENNAFAFASGQLISRSQSLNDPALNKTCSELDRNTPVQPNLWDEEFEFYSDETEAQVRAYKLRGRAWHLLVLQTAMKDQIACFSDTAFDDRALKHIFSMLREYEQTL